MTADAPICPRLRAPHAPAPVPGTVEPGWERLSLEGNSPRTENRIYGALRRGPAGRDLAAARQPIPAAEPRIRVICMLKKPVSVVLCTLLFLGGIPAAAEVGATGTRIQLPGGSPRPYMTYGHVEEPELYAPLLPDLRRLGITGRIRGEDFDLLAAGRKIVTWPIVRFRQDVPETGEHPCVLVMGGNTYLPVRRLCTLFSLDVTWDRAAGVLSAAIPAERQGPGQEAVVEEAVSTLQGVTIEPDPALPGSSALVVRVSTPVPIRPTWLFLKAPHRVVIDFAGARWPAGMPPIAAQGAVTEVRTGMFTPTTARLVLTLSSPQVRLSALQVAAGSVTATLSSQPALKSVAIDPEAEQLLAAIRSRRSARTRLAARGGLAEGLLPFPLPPPDELDPERPIEVLPRRSELPIDLTTSLAGRILVVDAGHGGHDPGARGLLLNEKDLTLQMALQLRSVLEERGATVVMTRESDTFISLAERVAFANQRRADLFISVHCNSTPRRNSGAGSETYWRTPQSHRLAAAMHRRLAAAVSRKDGGIRNRSFAVIRETMMPSVLLEIGYINNTEEELLMATPDFQRKLAESLVQGVLDYFAAGD